MSKEYFSFNGSSINEIPYVSLKFDDGKHSHSIKVAVKHGNNLFSYIIDGNETIFYDETLPMASFAVGNPLLFPFPNRITDAMWTWDGVTHLQKKNGIPIQLHSLIYDESSFEYETPVITREEIRLRTYISVDENHPIYRGYPFSFKLIFDFVLNKNGLKIAHTLENLSNETMPYGLGYHPYFKRISGDDNTLITVPGDYYYEIRTDCEKEFFNKIPSGLGMIHNVMPTGNLLESKGTSSDINTPKPVGTLDLDTVYTSVKANDPAVIDYSSIGLKLTIDSSEQFMHYVVYTPKDQPFFCIEPQTCSTDAINLYNTGIKHVNLLTCDPKDVNQGWVTICYQTK